MEIHGVEENALKFLIAERGVVRILDDRELWRVVRLDGSVERFLADQSNLRVHPNGAIENLIDHKREYFQDPESRAEGWMNDQLTLYIRYDNGDTVCEFANGIRIFRYSDKVIHYFYVFGMI